jgi:AraC-like DNA-binding protein
MSAVSSLFVRKVVEAAGLRTDRLALLRSVGIDPELPVDVAQMVTTETYYTLLEELARTDDGNLAFHLRASASMRCEDYGALGLAWKSAPTLGASFARAERYGRLLTDVATYEIRADKLDIWLILHRIGENRRGVSLSNEATLASITTICREASTAEFRPISVHFMHSAPPSVEMYEAFFGCEVVFSSYRNALLVNRHAVDLPNRLGDEAMSRFFISHLDDKLAKVEAEKPVETVVQEQLSLSLSAGVPKMTEIARRLGMSERTLHRRLSERGLSFQAVIETSRRKLAERLLHQTHYSLAEIAFLTGFSEQSALNRAFKRWTGRTPASYRQATKP